MILLQIMEEYCVMATVFMGAATLAWIAIWLQNFYVSLMKNYDYFQMRNIPFSKPKFLVGCYGPKIKRHESRYDFILRMYNEFKGKRFGGFFALREPVLMILDLELIEKILMTDFSHFEDRPTPVKFQNDLKDEIFIAKGHQWRNLRHVLTPAFNASKQKSMLPQMVKANEKVVGSIESEKNLDIDISTLAARYANNVIASGLFGFEEPSNENQRNIFLKNLAKKSLSFTGFSYWFGRIFPGLIQIFGFRSHGKELDKYFIDLTDSNMKYRKEKNILRDDFLQFVMNLKEQEEQMDKSGCEKKEKVFTEKNIASFLFTFLSVGAESVSNALAFCLMELSRCQEAQRLIRAEVKSALDRHGGWTYEALNNMPYVDAVIQETLRLYSVAPILKRVVTTPWQVPGEDLILEPGLQVVIPVAAIHRDPDYYDEPDSFRPERFMNSNFKPSPRFLAFGHGPRICIAQKLAVTQMKVCITKLVMDYLITWSDHNVEPLRMDPTWFFPRPVGGLWVRLEKIEPSTSSN